MGASLLAFLTSRNIHIKAMRIATFNLESLDLPPKAHVPLEVRAELLRPALGRLEADVLCLQEVNGQQVRGQAERELIALGQLLAGTPYADYHRLDYGPRWARRRRCP